MATKETENILRIKQGDQYQLPVKISLNGEEITSEYLFLLSSIEFTFEGLAPILVDVNESFLAGENVFLLPLTQEQTFQLEDGRTSLDIRVKFTNGEIVGIKTMLKVKIVDALSETMI